MLHLAKFFAGRPFGRRLWRPAAGGLHFVGSRTAFRLLCPRPAPLLHFQRFGIIVFNTILYSFSFPIKKLFFLTSRICLW